MIYLFIKGFHNLLDMNIDLNYDNVCNKDV